MTDLEKLVEFANNMSSVLYGYREASEKEMLQKVTHYTKGLVDFVKNLRGQAEIYYKEWTFCLEHKFELEAILQRTKYDLIMKIVLNLESEYDIDSSDES